MSNKLLPCPFCGREAESIDNGKWEPVIDEGGAYVDCDIQDPTWYGVQCTKCFCQLISEEYTSEEEAITAWNRRAGGWIPVEERLPEKGECLVAHTDGTVYPASVIFGKDFKHCTHWMPLPEPPEAQQAKAGDTQ